METMGVREYLRPQMDQVEAFIQASLVSDISLLDAVNRQLREHPGKMLRPTLTLLCAGALGKINEDSIRYAAAAELLHNSTLLHDDVVDGATERRGLPTVSSLLGGPAAVLIGDFWLTKCMDAILGASIAGNRVLHIFARTLGALAEGELLQMQKAQKGDTCQEEYIRIIYCKTASLFESSARSGALSVEATEGQVRAVGEFARLLGIAFQIKDDIFDYADSEETIGKPVGIDLLEQKITQPLLCVLDSVSEAEADAVREKVVKVAGNPALASEVRAFVLEHDGVQKAEEKMQQYISDAVACLEILPETPEKNYLKEIARFVGKRNY